MSVLIAVREYGAIVTFQTVEKIPEASRFQLQELRIVECHDIISLKMTVQWTQRTKKQSQSARFARLPAYIDISVAIHPE